MKNEKNNYPLIAFVVAQIVFVLLLVVSIPKIFVKDEIGYENLAEQPKIAIEGLKASMLDAPDYDVGIMNLALLKAMKENAVSVDFATDKAVIRDGTAKTHYFENANIHYYSAIVDIPGLEQSYWIFHEYSDDKDNAYLGVEDSYLVLCLADTMEKIYSDFDCKSDYAQLTYNAVAMKYIKLFNFEDFLIYETSNDYELITVVLTNGTVEEDGEKYVDEISDAILSLGISPDLFEYELIDAVDAPYVQWTDEWGE